MLLTACSNTQPITISSAPTNKPAIAITPPDEVDLREVTWIVINNNNLEQKIQELTADNNTFVLFALTPAGYQNLSLNISDIRALLQQQREIIVAYRNYYESQ